MKKIPKFKNEDEERKFWASHDSTDYVDWGKGVRAVFPNLKLANLSDGGLVLAPAEARRYLEELKLLANKRDVPYQSLLKIFLAERIDEEIARHQPKPGLGIADRRTGYGPRKRKKK